MKEPLALIGWNAWEGNEDWRVKDTLTHWQEQYNPAAILGSELSNHFDVTDTIPGLMRFQEEPISRTSRGIDVNEQGDTAILLADDLTDSVEHQRVLAMKLTWKVFSHDKVHSGRRFQTLTLKREGRRVRLLSAHPPTLGFNGPNGDAFMESMVKIRRWLRRGALMRNTTSLVVGDMNERKSVVADWFGPNYTVEGEGIDLFIGRGVRRIEHERLGRGGSDVHHGQLFRVWWS